MLEGRGRESDLEAGRAEIWRVSAGRAWRVFQLASRVAFQARDVPSVADAVLTRGFEQLCPIAQARRQFEARECPTNCPGTGRATIVEPARLPFGSVNQV